MSRQNIMKNYKGLSDKVKREAHDILSQFDPDLLIPKLELINKWKFQEITNHMLYLARPMPFFSIRALYMMFYDAFRKLGIDPQGTVDIRKFRTKGEEKILHLKERSLKNNKKIFGAKSTDPRYQELTVRWVELRTTLIYTPRTVRISLFKNTRMDENESAPDFMFRLHQQLHYPLYFVVDAIINNHVTMLHNIVKKVRINNIRGWKIQL